MKNNNSINKYYHLRKKKFDEICGNFKHKKINDLVVVHKINYKLFLNLKKASKNYLEKSKVFNLANMTPNGKLMPKKELEKEYNKVVEKFRDVIISLNIEKKLRNWSLPAIRYKEGKINKKNILRNTRSELPHSDSWAGWDENSILVQIPLLGDTKKNKVQYYKMPHNLDKTWLGKKKFNRSNHFVSKCKRMNNDYKPGYIYISDISVVHRTFRNKNSKSRMSIDIPLIIKSEKPINKNFSSEIFTKNKFNYLGKKYSINCPVKMNYMETTPIKFKLKNS